MRLRLPSHDSSFDDLFRSAAGNLLAATELFGQLLEIGADRPALVMKIRDAEQAGDEITHAVLRRLDVTLFSPFDRQDIHRLATQLDDVLDAIEAAADRIVLFQISVLPEEFEEIAAVLTRAARSTVDALPRLRAFRDLTEYWIEINELQNEAEQLHRRILARLFDVTDAVGSVLKLADVAAQLAAAATGFERVAETVQGVVVKGG